MFFAAKNLVTQSVEPSVPWEFKPSSPITAQVRANKEDRQLWYQNTSTEHCFYTGLEGINPNMRVSRENPPHRLHAISADYDVCISDDRAAEAVSAMKYKPAWTERSLGGNLRLVWLFSQPLLVSDYDFCGALLAELRTHLQLELLPALDSVAFDTPSRLLANGCNWKSTGHPEINLQAFYVKFGRDYRFTGNASLGIPLDVVETAIKAKYPGFAWPTEFTLESTGPSWFIPGSESSNSAIVKAEGIFTFSAHAAKPFYSWLDILGAEFVRQYQDNSIAKATEDIWWDGKRYWRKISGIYSAVDRVELLNYFKVDCKLSFKANSDGISPVDIALSHIHTHGRIESAAPFIFRPAGLLVFLGDRKLNTYVNNAIQPATGTQQFGDHGNFPFISMLLSELFDPVSQLAYFLAWHQHYYRCAFECDPHPGQNIFLMGIAGAGKTLTNRELVGASVGGYMDASSFLVEGGQFNSHLLRVPHWCLDDDSPSASLAAQARFHAMFKKTVANQQFLHHKKFEQPGMTEWMGRIGATTNMDYVSSRLVGPLDNGTLDKISLFRCSMFSKMEFVSRKETIRSLRQELPHYLRYLLDWVAPDEVERDSRYGVAAFQHPMLLDHSHQSSTTAPFKEVLIETLFSWFKDNKEKPEWVGTVSAMLKLIMETPGNEVILKSMKLESINRYLEQIQKEGLLKCECVTGPMKTRIWKFKRDKMI